MTWQCRPLARAWSALCAALSVRTRGPTGTSEPQPAFSGQATVSSDLDFLKDMVVDPDPGEIADHAIAFARMMFAHTALERGIGELQDTITKQPGFGEQRANQWHARARPALMVVLIEAHRGKDFPHTDAIAKLLKDAIDPCDQHDLLAHGTWWSFHRPTATIIVRSPTRWEHPETPPKQREYTASDIRAVADRFEDIAAELYKLRGSIADHDPPAPV